MEYIYAALLLHKLGKPIDENGITKVISSAGASVDESKVKNLVASLKGLDIEKELANAAAVSAVSTSSASGSSEHRKEEAPKAPPKPPPAFDRQPHLRN